MNRLIILGLAATMGAAYTAMQGTSVELQPTSPGTAQTGHLNISGTARVGVLRSSNTVFGESTAATGYAYGGYFTAASNQARGFYGYASSPTGLTYGGFFQNASESGRAVYGLATSTTGFNYGGYFQTASTSGRGLLGVAAAPTGTTYGVYGTAVSPTGYGVYSDGDMHATGVVSGNGSGLTNVDAETFDGYNYTDFYRKDTPVWTTGNFNTAIRAETNWPGGTGVKGYSVAATTNTVGLYGEVASTSGKAISGLATAVSGATYGVYALANSTGASAIYAEATSPSGTTYGVRSITRSTSGTAISAQATATSGSTRAGLFRSESSSGAAIEARASASSGSTLGILSFVASPNGQAVFGYAEANSGLNFGVQGVTDSATGYGVYSFGRFGASGTKSFRVDHPLDPENKYLLHYSTESPSRQNFYSGNVTTDASGYAWVQLPDYFDEINKNFKYQLTVVDDGDANGFVMAKVSRAIRGNRFQLRTSAPNMTVSWRIEADRNDLYMRNRPSSDEEPKVGYEKGTYQYPEFYGQPSTRGVIHAAMYSDVQRSTDPQALAAIDTRRQK